MTKRESRIAALESTQKAEIERQNSVGPFEGGEIPTKLMGRELVADLEDEFFGGFQESETSAKLTDDVWRRVGKGRFSRRVEPSPWGRVWGRVDITVERFGRPVLLQHIPRRWAAERPTNGPHPYVLQAARQAEQRPPEVTPELDQARELENRERYFALLEEKTDPKAGPSDGFPGPSLIQGLRPPRETKQQKDEKLRRIAFAQGVLREEKETLIRRTNEARIQRFLARRYKPSRALEEKRFPKLGKVDTKLVPKTTGVAKADLRAKLEQLVAKFDGDVQFCPPETTTRMLNKRPVGRPRKHPDNAAKQKAYREARRVRETLKAIRIFEGDNGAIARAGDHSDGRCNPLPVDFASKSRRATRPA